ncbi:50S ribosomal protein L29 [Candidatus Saccharibacteria bacterium]|nr:50S ribosomal protein L29 [Candidatus Saccharibacteria bacterium]
MVKTTKTTVKKTSDKQNKSLAELRADLLTAKKSLHDGTLHNPHAIRSIKKDIARALTNEKKGEK